MKLHEYQAKEILRRYGVPTPRGIVVESPEAARSAAQQLGGRVVVKAQIHAGGRGKGGGVKLAKDPDDAVVLAKKILGMTLVTHQTGPTGQLVRKVLTAVAADDQIDAIARGESRETPGVGHAGLGVQSQSDQGCRDHNQEGQDSKSPPLPTAEPPASRRGRRN